MSFLGRFILFTLWICLSVGEQFLHDITGHISITNDPNWISHTYVSAGFGQYYGYVQQNGSFIIPNVKPGM